MSPAQPPVVRVSQRWDELIGPFYDSAALEQWLGITARRLNQRVEGGELLGLLTTSRRTYYPAWQFTPDREVVRGVPDVIRGLGERSAYNKALWLKSRREEFGNQTVTEVLTKGDPSALRTIIEEARDDGASGAR